MNSSLPYRPLSHLIQITTFQHVHQVPGYIEKVYPFFLTTIMIEILIRFIKHKLQVLRIPDFIASLSAFIISIIPHLLVRSIELEMYIKIHQRYNWIKLPWDSPQTWWLCLLGVDLAYYFVHRFAHEINLFWIAHQVHHSSQEFNLTIALRQSFLQQYFAWIFYLPLALFIPPSIFLVHIQFNLMYQFWVHTEIIDNLGPLEYIFNTPKHHRVHHARNPEYINKNYGGIFIIWDRLLGTFEEEVADEVYGLTAPVDSWHPVTIQFGCFIKSFRRFLELEGILNKLAVWWKGPGWRPGTPRLGNKEAIPMVDSRTFVKYDLQAPRFHQYYCLLHFLLTLVGNQLLIAYVKELQQTIVLSTIIFILLSLYSFGALLEKRPYGPHIELCRCILYILADLYISSNYNLTASWNATAIIVRIVYLFSCCVWMIISRKTASKKTV
ncbi:Alkylglycerol monooxygenase [Trichoplax sp. H2]|nr:Alkylglycerol monooxygenase [Trichoplax sp. H2]|eukprot:RDD45347.1 Alkylglycerol monooxygenase [Trichoplax sp. H2]